MVNCSGKLLNLETPVVMAILNVTPDSFYENSRVTEKQILQRAEQHLQAGAGILDIGGVSTRPNAPEVSEKDELKRVVSAIHSVKTTFPEAIISIDTFRSNVARAAVSEGASIINDVSAGGRFDAKLLETVAELGTPYILMHSIGTPQTMQNNPNYKNITSEVLDFFSFKINELRNLCIKDIIIDVGFGFGKTTEHNYELLRKLQVFEMLDCPILAGVSRKTMIWKPLEISPEEALNGTTALHIVALQNGAKILRVHDTKPAIECIKLFELITTGINTCHFAPKPRISK